jgi:hypothetical protein
MIKQLYPDIKTSVYKLRKLYKEHKIKKKLIRMTKITDRE